MIRRQERFGLYIGIWIPLIAAYWLALYDTGRGSMSPAAALAVAVGIGVVPILATPLIWRATSRIFESKRRPAGLVLTHVVLALVFVAVWTGWNWLLMALDTRPSPGAVAHHTALAWQAVISFFVYVMAAAVSHAIQSSIRARDLALAAERAERLRLQAELASLRAHLNPHFLFNALHTVNALFREDQRLAERAMENLGELFRYVLRLD